MKAEKCFFAFFLNDKRVEQWYNKYKHRWRGAWGFSG